VKAPCSRAAVVAFLLLTPFAFAQTKPASRTITTPAPKPGAKPLPKPGVPAKPGAVAAGPVAAPGARALATVNGSPITRDHLEQAVDNQWAVPVLRDLIEDRLIRQEARRAGLTLTPREIETASAAQRAKFANERAFKQHLRSLGLTEMAFTENLSRDLLLAKLLGRADVASEAEVSAYYEAHRTEFAGVREAHLLAIVTTTVEDAYLARERLAAGDRFDVVAKELSVHESRNKGGDLGWVKADALPDKSLADAVFALGTDVVSKPLRAGNNYWICLVREVRGQQSLTLEQARPAIVEKLRAQRKLPREAYLRELARKADIVVSWPVASYLTEEYRVYRQLRVIVDGKALPLDPAPVKLPNGAIVVPAKPVLQAIEAELEWNAAEQSLTASTIAGRIKLVIGSTKALAGTAAREVVDVQEAPAMRAGTLWISPRPVLTALGARVDWDAAQNALIVTSPAESVPSPTVPVSRGGLEKRP
jgi:foldase protein PrsA